MHETHSKPVAVSTVRTAVTAMLALVVIFFVPLLWGGRVIFPGDNLFQWFPWTAAYPEYVQQLGLKNPVTTDPVNLAYPSSAAIARSLRTAGVMLWDPYSFSGSAVQTVGFYPPHVLLQAMGASPAVASTLSIVLHSVLSALLMFAFCRLLGISLWGSVFAGALYALNGYVLVWLEFETIQRCLTWLPGVGALLLLGDRRRQVRYALAAGALVALIISSGNLQFALYDLGLIVVFALVVAVTRRSLLPALSAALAVATGLAATSVYYVQQYSVLAASTRQSSPNVGASLPPENALTLAWPSFFGNPVDRTDWGGVNYTEGTFYFGVLGLLCVVLGLLALRRRERTLLVLFVVVVAGVAMRLPVFRLAELLPILRSLAPGRHLFVLVPIFALLAGLGFDQLRMRITTSTEEHLRTVRLIAAAGLLIVALPVITTYFFRADADFVGAAAMTASGKKVAHFVGEAGYPIAIWFGILVLAAIPARHIRRTSAAMIAIACLDLMVLGWHYNTVVPRSSVYPPLDEISFLKSRGGKFRVAEVPRADGAPTYPPNTLKAYGIETVSGFGSFLDPRYIEYARLAQHKGADYKPWFVVSFSSFDSRLIDAMNVRYVLSTDPTVPLPAHFVKRFDTGYAWVFENSRALPRAYSTPAVSVASGDEEARALLTRPEWDPASETILEVMDGVAAPPPPRAVADEVKVVNYSPHLVDVKVRSRDSTLLVLADTFAEGWRASIDGADAPIYRANYIHRGVPVPAGEHVVRFIYRPKLISTSLLVSAVLAMVAAALTLGMRRLMARAAVATQ